MKWNWNNIAFVGIVASLIFLYGFANQRNQKKEIKSVDIEFAEVSEFYIQDEDVYKLLIQSKDSINNLTKESLDLKVLESYLEANEMIKNAQVYLTVDGLLGAEIEQRKPILRFLDGSFHYLDDEGLIMPMSTNYSARVPIAFGFTSEDAMELFQLANAIYNDAFLQQQITSIHKNSNGEIYFELRDTDFKVDFGDLQDIDLKLANFKAFFAKAKKDGRLTDYMKVDLQFGKQVVCTRK
ncbi:cell division protein FtsQ/DivIB [Psychroflexus planctonicus]|uniref:Cell division protein FtsQ n=1 Tax=Psychroflexus planctonicus TaxID=1526575 RepID=A0ABQ1SH27_9FLAO|nr:cell division protein FtsQ/DivIB [Psychroflexus planctonicus]GGE39737.1 cell division protein FtsQ [Psychroflexus planctonicus]